MNIEEIKTRLTELANHEHTKIPGVEYLSFMRKNKFSFEDIQYEDYSICLFSIYRFLEYKDINKLIFRKLNVGNRTVIDEINGDVRYFDIFMTTKVKESTEDLLMKCFNEIKLVPMFIKVRP